MSRSLNNCGRPFRTFTSPLFSHALCLSPKTPPPRSLSPSPSLSPFLSLECRLFLVSSRQARQQFPFTRTPCSTGTCHRVLAWAPTELLTCLLTSKRRDSFSLQPVMWRSLWRDHRRTAWYQVIESEVKVVRSVVGRCLCEELSESEAKAWR